MTVSFAIVAYNEEKNLPKLLRDLEMQDYPHEKIEVLLIDSMSTDGTWHIMECFAQEHQDFLRIQLFQNEKKILPCGCNIALKHYTGDVIVRVDAHASIPADFISKNVCVLQEGGEKVCGGQRPNIIDEETPWKQTLLAAEQSMFGSGIASYRASTQRRYVSSIFHGMYSREVYDKVGLYNERLKRTEDNEMSYRIRQAGYQICYDPSIISYQHTRCSLKGMLRQKYLNGYWIALTLGVCPGCVSLFHLVPLAFVLGILFTNVLGVFGIWQLGALMWSAYGLLAVAMAVMSAVHSKERSWYFVLLPVLFLLLHVSYGVGSVVGVIQMPGWLKNVKDRKA